ncbi:MAG: 4a-hydroxytetrahydrobiopterin dehydratase [Deltaproteobacteria bacterium]
MNISSMVDPRIRAELLAGACAHMPEGSPALAADEVDRLLAGLDGWVLAGDRTRLRKQLVAASFSAAVALFARIATLADAEDHHPDVHLVSYRHVAIESWTHTVGALSLNDFILAAKIDALLGG